jgi:hypothetical protein
VSARDFFPAAQKKAALPVKGAPLSILACYLRGDKKLAPMLPVPLSPEKSAAIKKPEAGAELELPFGS